MRWMIVILFALAGLWAAGLMDGLAPFITQGQRAIQDELAGAVRAIRSGAPWALGGLIAVSFSYGVLHAAGPGHGKLVVGGYGMARRVKARRLVVISVLASLAQSVVAVALVYAGVAVLGLTRQAAQGVAEQIMAPLGSLAIAVVGLWLMWRGIAQLRHHHDEHHEHDEHCNHGPSAQDIAQTHSLRDATILIAGIALRPCTGAVFLLILTWQLGIGWAGIMAAFAMGLGTALVTGGIAMASVLAREGAISRLTSPQLARVMPWFQIISGTLIAALSLMVLQQVL
jgi:nickel/cobalt exporter